MRGGRPMLNGEQFERPSRISAGNDPLEGILLATGFHYEARVRELQAEVFSGLIPPGSRHLPRRQVRHSTSAGRQSAGLTPTPTRVSESGTSQRLPDLLRCGPRGGFAADPRLAGGDGRG